MGHPLRAAFLAFRQQGIPLKLVESFAKANKPGQFDCPGCAFPDKGNVLIDSCEQGQKAMGAALFGHGKLHLRRPF